MKTSTNILIKNFTRHLINESEIRDLTKDFIVWQKLSGEWYLEILLVGEQRIRALNHTHRHLDHATDVLSFSTRIDDGLRSPAAQAGFTGSPNLLGAIVICPSFAARKKERIIDLVVHGLIHLLSFDHQTNYERARWHKIEKKFWLRYQGYYHALGN